MPGEFFFPVIQNSGNTPAIITKAILVTPRTRTESFTRNNELEMRASATIEAPPDPSTLLHSQSATIGATVISNAVLGPKGIIQPVEGSGSETVSINDAMTYIPGTYGPYFFGAIEYLDIFKSKHIEMYCYRINNLMVRGGTGTHIQPARCSHWNCADKQCDTDRMSYSQKLSEARKPLPQDWRLSPAPPAQPQLPPIKTFIVFFDFDKATLTEAARAVIQEAVKTAKANGFVKVQVKGHTDTVGSDSDDQRLSVDRAQAVKDEMVHEGIGGSNIGIEGRSFHDLLVPSGPGVRVAQNNRVVIDLAPGR